MFSSETVTRGVRVRVKSQYDPSRSRPNQQQWFFLYTIQISNEGAETVQLISRHWIITDANGKIEEVQGPGVVGEHPCSRPDNPLNILRDAHSPRHLAPHGLTK